MSDPINGIISTLNSTFTNLGASGVFTGQTEDVSNYADAKVSVYSSHASATDGFKIQVSMDGTNWYDSDPFTIGALSLKTLTFGLASRYFRVVYTNGATPTTTLQIQVIFKQVGSKNSSVRPQDARSNENDMEEGLSYQMVFNGTSWDRQRGDTTGGMYVQNRATTTNGGALISKVETAATTNTAAIKASAGNLLGWSLTNVSAAAKYVKLYNKATAPTIGTDVPVLKVAIPAGQSVTMPAMFGYYFSAGIAIAITGAVGDADATATAAGDVVGHFQYI